MSSSLLKIIACVFMLIDHIGFCLYPTHSIFRIIGRLAFPIFAFQVSVGFKHTKSKFKYILRMFIFALVSQLPFLYLRQAANYNTFALNIGFTFFISLICLWIIDLSKSKHKYYLNVLIIPLLCVAHLLNVDYKWYGIIIVILFYLFNIQEQFLLLLALFYFATVSYIAIMQGSDIQLYAIFSLFILLFFNNKKGINIKYLFYLFYPLHLLILGIIKNYLFLP